MNADKKIDLNCDMGELPDAALEEALMAHITSANVACGGAAWRRGGRPSGLSGSRQLRTGGNGAIRGTDRADRVPADRRAGRYRGRSRARETARRVIQRCGEESGCGAGHWRWSRPVRKGTDAGGAGRVRDARRLA